MPSKLSWHCLLVKEALFFRWAVLNLPRSRIRKLRLLKSSSFYQVKNLFFPLPWVKTRFKCRLFMTVFLQVWPVSPAGLGLVGAVRTRLVSNIPTWPPYHSLSQVIFLSIFKSCNTIFYYQPPVHAHLLTLSPAAVKRRRNQRHRA